MTNVSALAAQLSPKARERLMQELIRAGTAVPAEADSAAEPIAVVGVGCRFPGNVTGPESFWQLLTNGGDAITEVPADRWDVDAFYDPDPSAPGRMTTRWGGFIPDAGGFDADFFGIAPREATAMDPQHRILLEVAWEALEHAGIPPGFPWRNANRRHGGAVHMGLRHRQHRASSRHRRLSEYRNPSQHSGRAAFLFAGTARSIGGGRHSMFVVLGGVAFGVPEPAAPRD